MSKKLTVKDAQPGWYLTDLATMTAGTGSVTIYDDGKEVASLEGGGVRKVHGQKFFQAKTENLSVEISGKQAIIHGPYNVQYPIDKDRVLSSTWIISSEDSTDNDYNDYTVRLTWYMSAG